MLHPSHVLRRRLFPPSTLPKLFLSNTIRTTALISATDEKQKLQVDLLRRCLETSNLSLGQAVHANLIKSHFSLYLHNHLLNFYLKCGHKNYGLQVFDEIPKPNVVSYSALISGLVQKGCPEKALSFFSLMHRDGNVPPNDFTLVSALQACSLSENFTLLYLVYGFVIRSGFESNVFLRNAFLTGLIREGNMVKADYVFERCLDHNDLDLVTWNAMMAGYTQFLPLKIPSFWYRMVSGLEGFRPDDFSFATVLTGLAALGDFEMGSQVHGQLVKSGHGGDVCIGNCLSDMYMKSDRMDYAFKAFREIGCINVGSWTQMASRLLQCGKPEKAVELIAEMRMTGVMPNRFTLATMLSASANMASLEEGRIFHCLRIKIGSEADVCVDNALLDMYVKVGRMEEAWVVFKSMAERSVLSWTTMIMGCAQNGQAKEGLMVFEWMRKEGVEPNYVTFIGVLYACSQGQFIEEGQRYFSIMSSEYGISPGEDHYACMVNLLGRTGRIKEAEALILSMPFQPGVLVWKSLLGACKLHGDAETGKRAAFYAMNLDGKDSSTYMLLSSILASLNNWDGVGMLRNAMQNWDVKKKPGSSWIESEKMSYSS